MALFPGSPVQAVEAAVAMQRELDEINRSRTPDRRIRMGIGVHVGDMMLGTIGAEGRMEATVIADAVNVASRLEGLTKELEARIIVSAEVARQLGETSAPFVLRNRGTVQLKGRLDSVSVFEVVVAEEPDVPSSDV